MFLDDLQKRLADMQGNAGWKAVFGDPIEADGHRLIPVASVMYGFGIGGGQGPVPAAGTRGRPGTKQDDVGPGGGGGGGGGLRVDPVALIDLSNGQVRVEPIINVTRLAVVALLVAGWSVFWMARAMRAASSR